MKYYKFFDIETSLKTLSDEIINTSYNKRYFVKNVLQDEIEDEYNTFVQNGITYNFEIQKGTIILLIENSYIIDLFTRLNEEIKRKIQLIFDKFGHDELDNFHFTNCYDGDTDIYANVKIKVNNVLKGKSYKPIDLQFKNKGSSDIKITNKIVWVVNSVYSCDSCKFDDINKIVVDGFNIFKLENGFKSINNITKFDTNLNAEDKFCIINVYNRLKAFKSIDKFNHYLITHYLMTSIKDPESALYKLNIVKHLYINTYCEIPDAVKNGIYWIKFENTNLINFQISSAELKYISIDRLPKFNPKIDNLYCAFTKIPIYDDFYIIDIYEQIIFAEKTFTNNLSESDKKKIKEYEKMGYIRNAVNAANGLHEYKKILKFDKPMQLAVHPILINHVKNFMIYIDSMHIKYIIYRTKYNKNVHDIIELFDINKAHKKLLHNEMNHNKLKKYNYKCILINNTNEINKSFISYTGDVVYELQNIINE